MRAPMAAQQRKEAARRYVRLEQQRNRDRAEARRELREESRQEQLQQLKTLLTPERKR